MGFREDINYYYHYRFNWADNAKDTGRLSLECDFFGALSEMRKHLSEDPNIIKQELYDARSGKLIVSMRTV